MAKNPGNDPGSTKESGSPVKSDSSLGHVPPLHKISSKPVDNFFTLKHTYTHSGDQGAKPLKLKAAESFLACVR